MCRSTCSSGWGFRDVSSDVSSTPFTRSARPKALRRTAVSVHLGSGWSQAPRPGSRFARSLTMRPSRATTLTSEDCGARCRQPRQVLTGSIVLPPALGGVARVRRAGQRGRAAADAHCASAQSERARRSLFSRIPSRNPAEYRSSRQSALPQGGRSGPLCRWRVTAGSRAPGPERPSSTGR